MLDGVAKTKFLWTEKNGESNELNIWHCLCTKAIICFYFFVYIYFYEKREFSCLINTRI